MSYLFSVCVLCVCVSTIIGPGIYVNEKEVASAVGGLFIKKTLANWCLMSSAILFGDTTISGELFVTSPVSKQMISQVAFSNQPSTAKRVSEVNLGQVR